MRTLYLLLLLPFLFSCERVKTEAPEETTLDSLLATPTSVIVVPVNFRVSDLEQMINDKIKGTVLKKWILLGDKGDSLFLEVSKAAPIHVIRKDRTIYYNIPAIISGKYIAKVAGIRIKNATPIRANVVLKMASSFHLDKKWNLVSETRIIEIVWKEEPTIKLGMIKVNLKPVLEKVLEGKETVLIDKADETLQKIINTRKIVQKLWLDIQKPIVINKKKIMVYLQANCTDITGRLLDSDPDLISMQFELKAIAKTYIEGDQLPPPNSILPDFVVKQNENDSLIMHVHAAIRFKAINKILNEELHGKKIEKGGMVVELKKLRVYGTPTGIAVELKVGGDLKGLLYAEGEPEFNSQSKIVAVRNLKFNLESESVIANSAARLLSSKLLDMISEKLEFDTETLADKLPEVIMRGVEKGKTGQKINIGVGHLDIWPQNVLVTKNDIQLLVKATGKASVDLEKKIFEGKKKK